MHHLWGVYQTQGWEGLSHHPEFESAHQQLIEEAVAQNDQWVTKKLCHPEHEFPLLSSALGSQNQLRRFAFAFCCSTNKLQAAEALLQQCTKSNWIQLRALAVTAIRYQAFGMAFQSLVYGENSAEIAYGILQEAAKCNAEPLFRQTLGVVSAPAEEDLAEMFLWSNPVYAQIMFEENPTLFERLSVRDLAPKGRENYEILRAAHQKRVLNSTLVVSVGRVESKKI